MKQAKDGMKKTTTLIILDGWGVSSEVEHNAVAMAKTPNFDDIVKNYPSGLLKAHGNAVGLPEGQMGNSEVGHTTIGAGRVVWMDLPKIDNAIADGSLANNPALLENLQRIKGAKGRVHIMGCASEGGVHAHENHLVALAQIALENGVDPILHLFTDGRDVAPKDGERSLPLFLEKLPKGAKVGSVSGRFYAMDRDNRWERVEAAYDVIVNPGDKRQRSVLEALSNAYARGESDEFVEPTRSGDYDGAKSGDGVIFANFRADRARQILAALAAPDFNGFERPLVNWSSMLGMVSYSSAHDAYMDVMFPKDNVVNTLGEVVAKANKTQFRLAETEKYPHVTFFMNGGNEEPNEGEERYMAPSPKVRTYDLKPEMSAEEVGDQLEAAILSGKYDLIICNFANPDMVGHTGDLDAAIRACEAVDHELGRALKATLAQGAKMIVTADHGNCEQMWDPISNGPHTAHTLNPVRFSLIGHSGKAVAEGGLCDLAPTLLHFMGLEQPAEMTGQCLAISQ